MPIKIKLL